MSLSLCHCFVLIMCIIIELFTTVLGNNRSSIFDDNAGYPTVAKRPKFFGLKKFPYHAAFPSQFGRPFGYSIFQGRIVGGEYTLIRDFPHQVSLMYNSKHVCGGSILSSTVIVTAAHCSLNESPKLYSIRAGSTFRSAGGVTIPVAHVEVHKLYDGLITDYDVAIMKLEKPLKFSREIQPIELATENDRIVAKNMGSVTGWGDSTLNNYYLQKVQVPIMPQEECEKAFKGREIITKRMFCASFLDNNRRDACQGDSGGPFTVNYKLYGITSWGYECGSIRYPGVYVRLTDPAITSWIHEMLERFKEKNEENVSKEVQKNDGCCKQTDRNIDIIRVPPVSNKNEHKHYNESKILREVHIPKKYVKKQHILNICPNV